MARIKRCVACTQKKKRCDGVEPSCALCLTSHVACVYDASVALLPISGASITTSKAITSTSPKSSSFVTEAGKSSTSQPQASSSKTVESSHSKNMSSLKNSESSYSKMETSSSELEGPSLSKLKLFNPHFDFFLVSKTTLSGLKDVEFAQSGMKSSGCEVNVSADSHAKPFYIKEAVSSDESETPKTAKRKNHRSKRPKKTKAQKEQIAQAVAERNAKIASRLREHYADPKSMEQEADFLNKPSIELPVPDALKALLVDDWENVTRNNQLVAVPKELCVTKILAQYLAVERPRRIPGSAEETVLDEIVSGIKVYFDKALGRILLYTFEREQYREMCLDMDKPDGELAGKTAADIYGAEHLARMIVSLPELVVQTNMDQQSTNRLREEMVKFANWLSKNENTEKFFSSNYETPNQAYIDKARGT